MEFAVHAGAASARSPPFVGKSAGRPSIAPWTADFADTGPSDTGDFPEIDCIRPLLAADVLAAAEQRAAAVGVGADRVLVASGAVSEEAYLRALPIPRRTLRLGEDRAWPGEKLAACRHHDAVAAAARALSQPPERNRQPANAGR